MEKKTHATHQTIPDAIDEASEGDVIIVSSETLKELGEIAAARMRPGVDIKFSVELKRTETPGRALQ